MTTVASQVTISHKAIYHIDQLQRDVLYTATFYGLSEVKGNIGALDKSKEQFGPFNAKQLRNKLIEIERGSWISDKQNNRLVVGNNKTKSNLPFLLEVTRYDPNTQNSVEITATRYGIDRAAKRMDSITGIIGDTLTNRPLLSACGIARTVILALWFKRRVKTATRNDLI